jgi:hypothetical protein
MPARGEHDDFETAQSIVHAGLAALAAGDLEGYIDRREAFADLGVPRPSQGSA